MAAVNCRMSGHYSYTREERLTFPIILFLHEGYKFWPFVARVNNAHGDRNLICTCPPLESYEEEQEGVLEA